MHETNAGIMIFPDGLVGATGNQTAGDSKPYLELPANKVPTSVALTLYNEFALRERQRHRMHRIRVRRRAADRRHALLRGHDERELTAARRSAPRLDLTHVSV